ncbi:MAG TPA: dienelactone hydrolase family protein [Ruminiclostridium sp.]
MEKYYESFDQSNKIRHDQYNQLVNYLSEIIKDGYLASDKCFNPDFSSIEKYSESSEKYRQELEKIIGYPPPHHIEETKIKEEYVGEDDLCFIYRIYISVDVNLDCYGLYLIPKAIGKKAPLLLSFHGGGGCPELICNFERTDNYNDASRKFLKEGFIVFSPLFSFRSLVDGENTDIPQDMRSMLDNRAKWAGTSLAAIEVFKVRKALDYLLTRDEVDTERVGLAGLSYGGFYALLVTALDIRIKFCISSCYFNDRVIINEKHPFDFFDWTWKGSINEFSDAQLVALVCPRPCFIEVGLNDDLFPVKGARSMLERASEYYTKLGIKNRLHYFEFEGGHEFNLEFLEYLRNNMYF